MQLDLRLDNYPEVILLPSSSTHCTLTIDEQPIAVLFKPQDDTHLEFIEPLYARDKLECFQVDGK